MTGFLSRRTLLGSLAASPVLLCAGAAATRLDGLATRFADIERRLGGRLGVAVIEAASGRSTAYRGDERFPLCSTYKVLAAACVLARVDHGEDRFDRRVAFGVDKLVAYSPATKDHAGADGMTVGALCEAAVTLSDNTAGNLLLDGIGGPAGLTAWLRAIGDGSTRLDRMEPQLNEAAPGDPRDTTTPLAMAETLRQTVVGETLAPASRERLAGWLVASRTGDKRLRAGLPDGWRAGDRTGSGERATTNDVAVLWPPDRHSPLIVTAYCTGAQADAGARDAALAQVGRLVVDATA